MKWKIEEPNILSAYTYCNLQTPIGLFEIEWNQHESPVLYRVYREGYIGQGDTLEEAKKVAEEWLEEKAKSLIDFICS